MISAATRLVPRLIGVQLFCTCCAALAASTARWLLLLDGVTGVAALYFLWGGIGLGGLTAVLRTWLFTRRYRHLLRALALRSESARIEELSELSNEAGRTTVGWLISGALGLLLTSYLAKPRDLDLATGTLVGLLGVVVLATASLPLYVLARRAVMRALELAPVEVSGELVPATLENREIRSRVQRRILVAFATPVAFVAVGSLLVVSAHVVRSERLRRDATALGLARAAFEPVPGPLPQAGLKDAIDAAQRLGFRARYEPGAQRYRRVLTPGGTFELTAPLDEGAVRIRFADSSIRTLTPLAWFIAALATALAAALGTIFGGTLVRDLATATRGVHALDTHLVLAGGAHVVEPTVYQVVADLGAAIEKLAGRFRVFAEAQERAIGSRSAATRMRGFFFATVSHDLKSPLNAILGFSQVIRQTESLTPGQEESLDLIQRRANELLALIETILDAARVEAKQLSLVSDRVTVGELMHDIIAKGRHLAGENPVDVVGDIADGVGTLKVDRVRLSSALATFIGHAARTVPGALVRLRVAPLENAQVGFAIEMPSPPVSSEGVRQDARSSQPAMQGTHRGLALGMGLAQSIVELHGGRVTVQDRGSKGLRFVFRIPARAIRTGTTGENPIVPSHPTGPDGPTKTRLD